MLRAAFLVHLTLWAVTVHAFFPWYPTYLCSEDDICATSESKRAVEGQSQPAERATAPKGLTFKLSQRSPGPKDDLAVIAGRAAKRLAHKYARLDASSTSEQESGFEKRTNTYAVVTPATPTATNSAGIYQDGTDFSYFIEAGIGSSPKSIYMLLDSGAGTTWVMGSTCESTACTMHNSFGPDDSTTYKAGTETFSISYGSGSVSGSLVQDSISVADLKISMTFGLANVTSDDFTHFPFDGILGLSMSSGATNNFLTVLKASKILDKNIFSVSLSRNSDGPNTGEVTFGAIDDAKYTGTVTYTSVSTDAGGDWAIPLDALGYDDKKADVSGTLAYVDTGTSYVFGPADDVAAIHALIPGSYSSDGITYTVPCSTTLPITVTFSGVAFDISRKDWLSGTGTNCTSNIYGHEVVKGSWLLGDLFLKNVYAVFDADESRIGFASKPVVKTTSTITTGSSTSSATDAPSSLATTVANDATTTSSPTATVLSSMPGLSGHETAATAGGTAVAETSSAAAKPTQASSGDQLDNNKYITILSIVAVIALVA